jgi:hypothetical protein
MNNIISLLGVEPVVAALSNDVREAIRLCEQHRYRKSVKSNGFSVSVIT